MIKLLDGVARTDADLGPLNVDLRDEENHYRALFVSDRNHPSLTPHVLLTDVFESPASMWDPASDAQAQALERLPKVSRQCEGVIEGRLRRKGWG